MMFSMPLLPLREAVVFPGVTTTLLVGRERSVKALTASLTMGTYLFLTSQKIPGDAPKADELCEIGTVVNIVSHDVLPDGNHQVSVEGKRIARAIGIEDNSDFSVASVEFIAQNDNNLEEYSRDKLQMIRNAIEELRTFDRRYTNPELLSAFEEGYDAMQIIHFLCSTLPCVPRSDWQALLEMPGAAARLDRLVDYIRQDYQQLKADEEQRARQRQQFNNVARPIVFKSPGMPQEVRAGGDGDEFMAELRDIEEKINQCAAGEDVRQRLLKELKKLRMMQPMSAEATVIRNYIDVVLSLPWGIATNDSHDILMAEKILNEDHYGLKKPKERILEYLAVQSLVEKLNGPILCFVGPPGVGKTSLAKSFARAMGRKFIRASLGGVKDEAEIRGHRRTYIGALPGKIIQSIRKAGSKNPVFLLDEVDKLSSDYHGDPSSALLEVLDPEQNSTFNDHYLDMDFDLSDVIFIATANDIHSIPIPLRDRMEIIEIEGYTEDEKLSIASAFLVPKQTKLNGIDKFGVTFSKEALVAIINEYTMEAGVRSLEREISTVCRKVACDILQHPRKKKTALVVEPKDLLKYLGQPRIRKRNLEQADEIGVTNALAVTQSGGSTLKSEVTVMPGTGKLIITGQLRDIMQESAQAAMSYVRSRATNFGLVPNFVSQVDIHVHFPGDHIPKDGPSAGITMATSIISALTRIPVKRDVAMTGEITLRGKVLAIGGLKEKLLAAKRLGVKTVIIPEENAQDFDEIPKKLISGLKVVKASCMEDVLLHALQLKNVVGFEKALRAENRLPIQLSDKGISE